jgi:hypothetical protein
MHLFSAAHNSDWLSIVEALEPLLGDEPLHVHRRVTEVCDDRCPDGGPVLVLISSDQELDELLDAKEQLGEQRLVVVLHDASPGSWVKGHGLRPRVLFSQPAPPKEVAAVIAKMLGAERKGARRAAR